MHAEFCIFVLHMSSYYEREAFTLDKNCMLRVSYYMLSSFMNIFIQNLAEYDPQGKEAFVLAASS